MRKPLCEAFFVTAAASRRDDKSRLQTYLESLKLLKKAEIKVKLSLVRKTEVALVTEIESAYRKLPAPSSEKFMEGAGEITDTVLDVNSYYSLTQQTQGYM